MRDVINFDFLEEGVRIVSSLHFVYDFSIKIFFMLVRSIPVYYKIIS